MIILQATYADADHASAIAHVKDCAPQVFSFADTPDAWAELLSWGEGNTIADYLAPSPPAYRLFKSVFIARLDEEQNEPETMEATLAAAPAKLRLLFNSVEYFVSDDPLFAELHASVALALGAQRADQLLAAEMI